MYSFFFLACFSQYRKEVVKLLEEIRTHLYHANHTWLTSIRRHLRKTLVDGLIETSKVSKPLSFISHPLPECSCLRQDSAETSTNASSPFHHSQLLAALRVVHRCPAWMESDLILQSKDKENEEDFDEVDSLSGLFFRQNAGTHEGSGGGGSVESNNKEEAQLEDQEELEGGDR